MSSTRSERSDGKGQQEPCTGQPADNRKPEPPDKQPQASRENRGREGGAERKAMAGPLSEDADELVSWTAGRLVQLGLDKRRRRRAKLFLVGLLVLAGLLILAGLSILALAIGGVLVW